MNPKNGLMNFLQKLVGRPMSKQDVVYTTHRHGPRYQTVVKLNCLPGEPGRNAFMGHLCPTPKAAEMSAAELALEAAAAMELSPPAPRGDPVSELVAAVQQLSGRPPTPADTVYTVQDCGGRFQATVQLPVLKPQGCDTFTGEPCPSVSEAKLSAAQHALWALAGADVAALPVVPTLSSAPCRVGPALPSHLNPKNDLSQFLQRRCKRPVTKEDIVYRVQQRGLMFEATIQLNCIDGRTYTGELRPNAKAAEMSAAEQALQANAQEVAAIATMELPKKRKVWLSGGHRTGHPDASKRPRTDGATLQ